MRALLPILSLLYSATMWGVLWYPLRRLEDAGLHGLWATLVVFGAPLLVGVWAALPHARDVLRRPWALLGMTLANGWCNVAFIIAILEGNVVRVTLLFFLSPLWATLLAHVFLKERVSRYGAGVLALAMFGAAIMLWDTSLGYPWPQSDADWLAISAGVSFALSNVFVRATGDVALPVKTALAWIGVSAVTALWIVASNTAMPVVPAGAWLGAAAVGLVAILTMTYAVQYGMTQLPVHRAAVILLFELVASAVSSQLLTEEIVLPREWLGGALIALGAYLSARSHLEQDKYAD
jgi:drug/metabolite transporter (DMT)-like permease